MSLSRFYLHSLEWAAGSEQRLAGEEAHHLTRVLRLREGEKVELFDGKGRVAQCEVGQCSKQEVRLRVMAESLQVPLPHRVHLMPALIKGEGFEWLLEKAVELGAASVRPLLTQNTVVQGDAAAWEKKREKWLRQMLAAAKQCHTPWLPELEPPVDFATGVGATSAEGSGLRLIPALMDEVAPLPRVLQQWAGERVAWILIGPEGDFTTAEVELAVQAGFAAVSLGPLILRAETAAIASLSCVSQAWYL